MSGWPQKRVACEARLAVVRIHATTSRTCGLEKVKRKTSMNGKVLVASQVTLRRETDHSFMRAVENQDFHETVTAECLAFYSHDEICAGKSDPFGIGSVVEFDCSPRVNVFRGESRPDDQFTGQLVVVPVGDSFRFRLRPVCIEDDRDPDHGDGRNCAYNWCEKPFGTIPAGELVLAPRAKASSWRNRETAAGADGFHAATLKMN